MIRRIKFRYSIHFRPVETKSPQPRKIHIELSAEARRRYPNAVVRARRIYFPLATYKPKTEILPGQKIAVNGGAGWELPDMSRFAAQPFKRKAEEAEDAKRKVRNQTPPPPLNVLRIGSSSSQYGSAL
jgi:hypothetical protein